MQITYTKLIKELSTKKITCMNICHFIDKCSCVIDDLGNQLMGLYEQQLNSYIDDTSQVKLLKHQQKKLIAIRDTLLNTYMDYKDLKSIRKSNRGMIEGVTR